MVNIAFGSAEEKDILVKFKESLADLEVTDFDSLRFLRARNHDLALAENMLRNSIEWRKTNNIDEYLKWEVPEIIQKYSKWDITGYDHDGCPVLWLPLGIWDVKKVIEDGYEKEAFEYVYHILEKGLNAIKKSKGNQFDVIFDLENLQYSRVTHIKSLQVFYSAFQQLESNYAECLKRMFIINSPLIFNIAFNFVKPVLTGTTMSKLHIVNHQKTKWYPLLLEYIPKGSLPEEYHE